MDQSFQLSMRKSSTLETRLTKHRTFMILGIPMTYEKEEGVQFFSLRNFVYQGDFFNLRNKSV